jgi:hypothetical protein
MDTGFRRYDKMGGPTSGTMMNRIAIAFAISLAVAAVPAPAFSKMPQCYDPRPAICTGRIAPCRADYQIVTKACKREGGCSLALIARVTADWNSAMATCTHTGMP